MKHKNAKLFVAFLMFVAGAAAQSDVSTSSVKGTVTDETGGIVVNAQVRVINLERGIERTFTTDSQGIYQAPFLSPGVYDIRIEAKGFETHILKNVQLTVGQIAVYDVQMKVGAVTAEVFITAEVPLVETEKTQQANTIQTRQVENLPNITRNFFAAVYTLPGVSSSNAPRAQGNGNFNFGSSGFSIGGSNGRANLITVDGGENEFGDGEPRFFLSPDATQEFQVNRNGFNAEYGFTAGTAVNVVTKSGSNRWHGSIYGYFRDEHTSARNFFDRRPTKAFDQQVYPGVTFGGPIIKDKLFFFTSYEAPRYDIARFRRYLDNPSALGPTADQAALIAKLNTSGDGNLQRIGGLLQAGLTPTNYPSTLALLRREDGTFTGHNRFYQFTTRIDYNVSSRDVINGRFSYYKAEDDAIDRIGPNNIVGPSDGTLLHSRDYTVVANWSHNFSPNVINQARVQFAPGTSARTESNDPNGTEIDISGFGNFGRSFTTPFNTFEKRYQFDDTLSWIHGNHFVKFGGSYRPVRYHVVNALWFGAAWAFTTGTFSSLTPLGAADQASVSTFAKAAGVTVPTLSALQNFSLGLPLTFRQGFNNPEWQDWANFLGLFVQDSWKVTPRFTVDYGVRFDSDHEPKPLHTYNHPSPRIGFAWDPFGDHKTVIRGGGGIFEAPVGYQIDYLTNILNDSGKYINQIFKTAGDPPAVSSIAIWGYGVKNGKLPFNSLSVADFQVLGIPTGPQSNGRVVFDAAREYRNTNSYQANFGITRQIVRDMSLDVAYNYYRGLHIQLDHEINYAQNGRFTPGVGPLFSRIDPTIAQFNNYSSIGNSTYNGMTVSLTKRYSAYSQFQINYTYSHSIDDVTDYNSAFAGHDPTNLSLERATSGFNITHNFVANAVLSSPFKAGHDHNLLARAFADITLAPVIQLRSGIPFSLLLGADANGDTHTGDRPIYASRNTGRGGPFYTWDMRLNKQIFFSREKGVRAELIFEAINLLNHTNFEAVNNFVGLNPKYLVGPFAPGVFNATGDRNAPSTAPLGFTSAFDPRRIQFGLKIAF